MTGETVVEAEKDLIRKRLLKYTRRAFRMLPELDKPRILDIGCGSGVPTMELARLSKGQVTGLDIKQPLLDMLTGKIEKAGLSDRVQAINRSIFDMDFADESFDVLWSEGSIFVVGFEKGLQEWRRLLKPGGFLVVHDEEGNIPEKLGQVSSCGYGLLGYFVLDEEKWRREYYAPLEELIHKIRTKHAGNRRVMAALDAEQREVEMVKRNPERYRSVFFVMKMA